MSDNTTVNFYDAHDPPVAAGTYNVSFKQNIQVGVEVENLSQTLDFHVAGPRFNVSPSLVHSVYPPKGGKGDYLADVSKLVVKRSTLPWERSPAISEQTTTSASWLYLMLIDQSETSKVTENNNVQLDIDQSKTGTVNKNNNVPQTGTLTTAEIKQGDTALGTVQLGGDLSFHKHTFNSLAVDEQFIKNIIPVSLNELQYLSYARIKEGEKEQGVLLCNRLPKAGSNSTVYLVSVENNYDDSGNFKGVGISSPSGNSSALFFPYYYKWSFHAVSEQLYVITEDLVSKITKANAALTLPDLSSIYGQLFTTKKDFLDNPIIKTVSTAKTNTSSQSPLQILQKAAMLPGSTFHGLLSNLSGGFEPLTLAAAAQDITATGTVELPFQQLQKNQQGDYTPNLTNAYYRGPLVASEASLQAFPKFPSKVADATDAASFTWHIPQQGTDLILKGTGGTDTSYAAAFELGRLMAINNVAFAKEFVTWKVQTATALRIQTIVTNSSTSHIVQKNQSQCSDMPSSVKAQFTAWSTLRGIPYNYLVANTELLPTESLRYFYMDINWVNALLCGAFSIGHTVSVDLRTYLNEVLLDTTVTYQGFLLNSFAVSGWPDYEVDAYVTKTASANTEKTILPPSAQIFRKNVSIDITMVLYNQPFNELWFYLHHSKVHSGFLFEDNNYEKVLNSGEKDQSTSVVSISAASNTISSLVDLATQIKAGSVSEFAAGMLEGTPAVQFNIEDTAATVKK